MYLIPDRISFRKAIFKCSLLNILSESSSYSQFPNNNLFLGNNQPAIKTPANTFNPQKTVNLLGNNEGTSIMAQNTGGNVFGNTATTTNPPQANTISGANSSGDNVFGSTTTANTATGQGTTMNLLNQGNPAVQHNATSTKEGSMGTANLFNQSNLTGHTNPTSGTGIQSPNLTQPRDDIESNIVLIQLNSRNPTKL
jgi:hypothetical protein